MISLKALTLCTTLAASVVAMGSSAAAAKSGPIFVQAQPEDMITRHVSYADLDLARPSGAHALMTRVGSAVNGLCDQVAASRNVSILTSVAAGRCSRASWDQARPQIDVALQRAREIAMTGHSSIAATALVISASEDR